MSLKNKYIKDEISQEVREYKEWADELAVNGPVAGQ